MELGLIKRVEREDGRGFVNIERIEKGEYYLWGTYYLMGMYVREMFQGSLKGAIGFAKDILEIKG